MTSAGPMSSDFSLINYHSPGVYSQAVPGPLVSVYNASPDSVGIVGQTRGYQVATESLQIPPDGGGTTSSLSAPVVAGASLIYTVNPFTDGTVVKIDIGDGAESPATVLNVAQISTTLTAASSVGDSIIKTVAPLNIGSSITIDSGANVETRTITNATGLATNLSASASNGSTTIFTPISYPVGTNIVIDSAGNVENRAVTAYSGGISTTLALNTTVGGATVPTVASVPVGSLLSIDTGGSNERHIVTAVTAGSTTTLSASSLVSATTISCVAPVSVGAVVTIDTSVSAETRTVSAVTGTGPYLATVAPLTYAHASGANVVSANILTLDTGLTSAHAAGAVATTLYALTVAPLAYAHVQGATIVAPQVGPFTLSVSALAKAHSSSVSVVAPPGLLLSHPLTYSHFLGAAVVGSGTIPLPTAYLSQQGLDESSLVVRNPTTGSQYVLGVDYTLQIVTGGSGIYNGADSYTTITRIATGSIPASKIVQFSYRYTNANYFEAQQFFSYNDLVDVYGPALDANGNIASELSFGASLAFLNGARRIVAAACTNPGSPVALNYQNALDQLKSDSTIKIVCVANGNQALHNMVKIHVEQESAQKAERRGIVGVDGSVTPVPSATRIAYAVNIYQARMIMVSPATAYYYNPILNTVQIVGGQFLACALAGLAVSINSSKPLTRMSVNGFVGIAETYSDTAKDVETQNGLLVLEKSNQGNIRVRHGVTTNPSSLLSREWTILGQQDTMVTSLRGFLDNDGIIGQVISELTLYNVRASVINALKALSNSLVILGYQNVSVRQLQANPDVVEISFEWRPAIPLNYVLLRFAIDISSGSVDTKGQFNGVIDASVGLA